MSLQTPAITELTVESGTYALFNEWLAKWFDGHAHAVGVNAPVVFPPANRAFGQGKPVQPLHDQSLGTDAEIRLVMLARGEVASPNDTVLYQGKLLTDFVTFNFWVSAKRPGAGQSQLLAERLGELLKAILTNPDARYELAERGITHLSPQGPAQWLQDKDYSKRLVSCNGTLQYAVQYSQDPLITVIDPRTVSGAVRSAAFTRETPLIVGTYLLGYYRWSAPTVARAAHVSYWPAQTQDVVLGLEVNGTLTGQTVTLPQGAANTDSNVDVTFSPAVNLDPNAAVRWLVVSGPAAELTAWHVTLSLDVAAI